MTADRVPVGDGATERVDSRVVGAGFDLPGQWHRGERLVHFEGADIVDVQGGPCQYGKSRPNRAGEHGDWVDADHGAVVVLNEGPAPEFGPLSCSS